jgi:hypothetical protein
MRFCIYCRKPVEYEECLNSDTFFVRGIKVDYNRVSALCRNCGGEIYIPELHDLNCMNRSEAYQQTIKELNEKVKRTLH